jgi:hypothetical protein
MGVALSAVVIWPGCSPGEQRRLICGRSVWGDVHEHFLYGVVAVAVAVPRRLGGLAETGDGEAHNLDCRHLVCRSPGERPAHAPQTRLRQTELGAGTGRSGRLAGSASAIVPEPGQGKAAPLGPSAVSQGVPQLATCYGSVTSLERICRGPGVPAPARPLRANLDHYLREGTLMRRTTSNAVLAALAEFTITAWSSGSGSMAPTAPASISSASQAKRSLAQAEELLVMRAAARSYGTACRLNRLGDPRPPREDDRCRRRWPAGSPLSELAQDA